MTGSKKILHALVRHRAVVLGAILISLVWMAVFFFLKNEHDSAERAAIQNSTNLAGAFEEHLSRSLIEIDRSLKIMRALYVRDPGKFDLVDWLKGSRILTDDVLQIAIVGRDGTVKLSTSSKDNLELPDYRVSDYYMARKVREMVKQAADQIQTQLRDHTSKFAEARAYVEQLHRDGKLDEAQVCKFAELRKFDETAAALSLLTDLPIGAIERAMVHDPGDQILVLAKSIDLSWKTTRAILMLDSGVNAAEYVDRYKKLRLETARSAIQFYRLRERATKTPPR